MKPLFKQRFALLSLAFVLLVGSVLPVFADDAIVSPTEEDTIAEVASIGKVSIDGNSYFELKQASILSADSGKMVAFTMELTNGDDKEIQFVDYWVHLQNKAGTDFSVHLMPQDKDKNRVPAHSSIELNLYASVNDSTNLQDLSFKFIRWDFSAANYERSLGTVSIPADYSVNTPVNMKRIVKLLNTPFKTYIKKAVLMENVDNYSPTLYFQMENKGDHALKIPDLQFSIRTQSGLLYPLVVSGLDKDTIIQPLVNKEILLTGSIPSVVSGEGWQLVITQSTSIGDNANINIPLAIYEVPNASMEDVSLGQEYEFSDKAGMYTARLNAVQRLPWEDQDILTADISLLNKGSQALPIPVLTGYFKLDDAVNVDAKSVRTDKVIALQPGSEISMQITAKIPYRNEFSTLKLFLQEKDPVDKDKVIDLLQFNHKKELVAIPLIKTGETFKMHDSGRSASYAVRYTNTFSGNTSDLFTAQLLVENQEQRLSDITKLAAHFNAPDGTVFPATISEIKSKIIPGGKALLYISTPLPKGYNTKGMQITIGEAVTEGKLTEKDLKPDSYVKAVSFALQDEIVEPIAGFTNLEMFPYKISLSKIGTQINISQRQLKLSFDYDFSQNAMVTTNSDTQKFVIELKDSQTNYSFIQELDWEKEGSESTSTKTDASSGNNTLLFGKHSLTLSQNDSDLIYKLVSLKTFTLNIYYQLQPGQKKLIASKDIDWFILYTD